MVKFLLINLYLLPIRQEHMKIMKPLPTSRA